jgi:ABC-type Zn uptake system ZnuABC Zn-binding protein ZnuA
LAETITDEGVTVIFADVSSSIDLAQTLADEVGDIEVVELFPSPWATATPTAPPTST